MTSRDNWESHWCHFAESASTNPAQRMRHALIIRMLNDMKENGRIRFLDIGSGQGDLLQRLSHHLPGTDLLGIESSESGVEISKSKVQKAVFVAGDLYHPPASLDRYEKWATHAVCSEVLEHLDDPVAFLKRAQKYLADGATLIVTVPGGKMSAFDRHIGHRRHFTRRDARIVLEQAGFQVERVYLAGFPFFNLYRLVVIARGERLVDDIKAEHRGWSKILAHAAMHVFNLLFRLNAIDSPFGWQVVAVVRNQASRMPTSSQNEARQIEHGQTTVG